LVSNPGRLVPLSGGDINIVLHQVFKEICLISDRNEDITGVGYGGYNNHNNQKLEPGTSTLI
jgi:hypothetical protein